MRDKVRLLFGFLIIILGVCVYLYPAYRDKQLSKNTDTIMEQIHEYRETLSKENESPGEAVKESQNETDEKPEESQQKKAYDSLYEEMQAYNDRIMEEGQQLVDAWSYAQPPVGFTSPLEGNAVGCIRIPDMNVELPLYIGATNEHMAAGAVVLSETSMPIGGEDTNCVIAGHRGYQGAPYFRDIELLKEGSLVIIENPWETLTYEAVEIEIVDPGDMESILIQPGKDMVTLLTCHPYMSGGKYRYIVYCERTENVQDEENKGKGETDGFIEKEQAHTEEKLSAANFFSESTNLIYLEHVLRIAIPVLLIILAIFVFKRKKR